PAPLSVPRSPHPPSRTRFAIADARDPAVHTLPQPSSPPAPPPSARPHAGRISPPGYLALPRTPASNTSLPGSLAHSPPRNLPLPSHSRSLSASRPSPLPPRSTRIRTSLADTTSSCRSTSSAPPPPPRSSSAIPLPSLPHPLPRSPAPPG